MTSAPAAVPGFSFHPFPQTPPLLPHFLSPGLGPFSPPLAGINSNFFGANGPSSLRNAAPGGPATEDSTPLQSPNLSTTQPANYFPMMVSPRPVTGYSHIQPESLREQAQHLYSSNAAGAQELNSEDSAFEAAEVEVEAEKNRTRTPEAGTPTTKTPDMGPLVADTTAALTWPARRASFVDDTKSTNSLTVPTANSINRGASLDIPRPALDLGGSYEDSRNGSALLIDVLPENQQSQINGNGDKSPAQQHQKKSPWVLPWLKK